jgi:hypothetical protein
VVIAHAPAGKKKVAGCAVTSGKLLKGSLVTVKRGKTVVYEGKVRGPATCVLYYITSLMVNADVHKAVRVCGFQMKLWCGSALERISHKSTIG